MKLDLHGQTGQSARAMAKVFLQDFIKSKSIRAEIVCGKGTGVVRQAVQDTVARYYRNHVKIYHPVYAGPSINTGTIVVEKR